MKTLTRIFREASADARQQFSLNELKMMLDVMNGTIVTPASAGRCLAANIEDSFRLYPGLFEAKWAIKNREEFERKINSLPPVFAIMLEIWAADFWEIDPLPDIDDYVSGKIKTTIEVNNAMKYEIESLLDIFVLSRNNASVIDIETLNAHIKHIRTLLRKAQNKEV